MKLFIYFSSLLVSVLAVGDLIILSHPKSLEFKGHERLDQSVLKEMYSAAMGFTVSEESSWSGMYIVDPFNLPEAIVTVVVDGVCDIGTDFGYSFPLHTNEFEENTWNALLKRVIARFPYGQNKLIRINLEEGLGAAETNEEFKELETKDISGFKYLNRATDEDQQYLKELAVLNGIVDKVNEGVIKQDRLPDVFWFILPGLHPVSDLHGSNSSTTIEAKQLLIESLIRMNDAFRQTYNGNVLVSVITTDASHTRLGRSLKADVRTETVGEKETSSIDNLNLAKNYNQDYPVIFNIILWFGVGMFFSLLAICITIANMDPGRDSIIYRMTSNRMKKDN